MFAVRSGYYLWIQRSNVASEFLYQLLLYMLNSLLMLKFRKFMSSKCHNIDDNIVEYYDT